MSGPQPGFLATYNSLKDKHLVGYFSNTRIRRHLQRSGLISRSGRIIPEKEYQLNAMRRDHQRYVQECLARAIFHKVLDMEYHHQLEIKRKLENSVRKERVQKIKVEHSRRSVEGVSPLRSPHPPLGPRNHYSLHPLVAGDPSGHSQLRVPGPVAGYNGGHPSHQYRPKEPASSKTTSWRPNTAPGNMQHPLRLQPLRRCAAVGSVPKTSSSKRKCHALERDQKFATGGERSGLRLTNSTEYGMGRSPYQLPVINSDVIPVPPPPQQKGDKSLTATRTGMPRGRRFRPTTAPNDAEQPLMKNSGGVPKPSLRSNAFVTMVFLGKSVHLSHDDTDYRDEIKVYQQHCGGENLCVYKGKLLEGETFQFISRRHHGFPFSLTFFLNGIQVDRLSCCCEYKHQKRSRLGGRHGYFGFLNVEGASPCYRCIIAMSLDKKPSPPKRKIEEDHEEKCVNPWGDEVFSEPSNSSVEQKSRKSSVLVIVPGHEASVETIEDKMETEQEYRKEEKKKLSDRESEDSQEDIGKTEYDEDFEADEEANEEGQTGDQMNGMSESSSDNKKHNLDYEKERETSSQKALQASDSEKDESDGCSDSDSEDDKQGELGKGNTAVCEKVAAARRIQSFYRKYKIHQGFKSDEKPARLLSSISTQDSSEDDSHAEEIKDDIKDKGEWNIKRASDDAAHAQDGYENRENELFRMEENQETLALEKDGIGESEKAKPEDLTAWEDTGIFNENIMAIQHQSPEVNVELEQAGSVGSTVGEDEEKNASTRRDDGEESPLVPLESSMVEVKDRSEESSLSDEGGAPDGAFLAEGRRTVDMQEAAEQVVQEGQMVGERQALEKEDVVAEGGGTHTEEAGEEMVWAGDLLPEEAVLQVEGQPAGQESAPGESTMAEEDPKGKGTGRGAVAPGEQGLLMEGAESKAAVGEQAPGEEELAGALLGRAEDGAVSEGEEVAEEVSEGEEAVEETVEVTGPLVKEVVGEMVSEGEEAVEEGGYAGKDDVVGALSEGEEAVEDVSLAEAGIARVVSPEGEESVEEAVSEGDEAVEKPGALLETSGDTNVCTGEAMAGGQDLVKPNEFSQRKASGEEQMERESAAIGAATSETGQASEVEGNSLLRAEDTVQEPVEPGKGPMFQVAHGLEALVGAGGNPISEGSSQLEETTTAGEEGSAEALLSRNPCLGSEAVTECAMEEKSDGEVIEVSAERAKAESGGGEEVTDGAAGPRQLSAGMEGLLQCAAERGKERTPVEGVVAGAWLLAPGLCVSEGSVVAVAVVGSQAAPGALSGEPGQEVGMAGDGRVDGRSVAQEGVAGAGESGLGTSTPVNTPVHEDGGAELRGRGSAGGEGLCPGTQPQLAAPGTRTMGGKDGPQERPEEAGGKAEGEQLGPCENMGETEAAGVSESAQSALGDREQKEDSPVGGSPSALGAADAGTRRCGVCEEVVHPDAVVVPSVQPQDAEETRF